MDRFGRATIFAVARILSISYNVVLLRTREMLLKEAGLDAVSVSNYAELLDALKSTEYDLCILGHSLPEKEKLRVFNVLKEKLPEIPILEIYRFHPDLKTGLTMSSQTSPEEFLETVLLTVRPDSEKAG